MQAILLADDVGVVVPPPAEGESSFPPSPPPPREPTVEELEHTINQLRQAAGIPRPPSQARQMDLGIRQTMDEDELLRVSNERTNPRVPVYEGFETNPQDDSLLDAGL